VGDSHVDIRAGIAAGMKTIGVLTGLDDYETLERENPTMILETVFEIRTLFT
jgi:phosphoglycolate phosphatase-like HAD superfamily hydrolase